MKTIRAAVAEKKVLMRFVNRGWLAVMACVCLAPVGALAQSGSLTGAGSTFVNPLMSKWSKEYHTLHPNVEINYQSIGSGGGRQQFLAKTVAFGASDAPLTDEQLAQAGGVANVVEIPVTQGAVIVAYNLPGVMKQLRFSPETIAGMYLGTIKLWNDPKIAADNPGVSLPALPVLVVHRSEGSGTTDIFTDYLSKVSAEWKSKVGRGTSVQWPVGIGGQGNEGVANQVRNTEGGVGYIELAYARQNKIAYGLVKNRAGNYVDPRSQECDQCRGFAQGHPRRPAVFDHRSAWSSGLPDCWVNVGVALQEPARCRARKARYRLRRVGHHGRSKIRERVGLRCIGEESGPEVASDPSNGRVCRKTLFVRTACVGEVRYSALSSFLFQVC